MMEEELEQIWEKERRTVLFVTNNIEEALYLADKIVLLNNCPTSIRAEYKINLPRPRNYVMRILRFETGNNQSIGRIFMKYISH